MLFVLRGRGHFSQLPSYRAQSFGARASQTKLNKPSPSPMIQIEAEERERETNNALQRSYVLEMRAYCQLTAVRFITFSALSLLSFSQFGAAATHFRFRFVCRPQNICPLLCFVARFEFSLVQFSCGINARLFRLRESALFLISIARKRERYFLYSYTNGPYFVYGSDTICTLCKDIRD